MNLTENANSNMMKVTKTQINKIVSDKNITTKKQHESIDILILLLIPIVLPSLYRIGIQNILISSTKKNSNANENIHIKTEIYLA